MEHSRIKATSVGSTHYHHFAGKRTIENCTDLRAKAPHIHVARTEEISGNLAYIEELTTLFHEVFFLDFSFFETELI